jgi:hypothetical protein
MAQSDFVRVLRWRRRAQEFFKGVTAHLRKDVGGKAAYRSVIFGLHFRGNGVGRAEFPFLFL